MGPAFRHPRARRGTSLVAAMALGFSGLLALPAAAKTAEPSDLVEACTDAPSASAQFTDYKNRTNRQKQVIDCLASGYKGDKSSSDFVLQGTGNQVNFDGTISRAQFAAILNRVADHIGVPSHSAPSTATFADVAVGTFFFGEIEELSARGLTKGAGEDTQDVDGDGNTTEPIYNPAGSVSYAQVLAFVHRLLTEPSAGNMTLATNQSKGQANNLDCGFFQDIKIALDNAGFLIFANSPADCKASSARGLVFDLIAVSLDEAVEQGEITNPHFVPANTVTLELDKASALANESVTATATVKDANGTALQGVKVDIFAVKSSDAFDTQGNPKANGSLNVAGTNRYGTGNQPAQIDSADPATNAQGKATASIMTTAASGDTYDVYAMIGDTAVVFKDVKGTTEASSKQTVTFNGVPAGVTVTSVASPRHTLKYNTGHTVTYQLVDSTGKPVKAEGVKVIAELFRSDDCAGAPTTTAPCNGAERRFAVQTLVTDANGAANWSVNGAPDPLPSNGGTCDDGVCDDGGDKTIDRFHGTWDQNGNGLTDDAVFTNPDFKMTFLDSSPGKVDVATFKFLDGNNPNRLDVTGGRVSTTKSMEAFVTDVYGQPAVNVSVQFSRGLGTDPLIVLTGANGKAAVTVTGPAAKGDWTWTATVDNDIPANGFGPTDQDLAAKSPTGGSTLAIHWLAEPAAFYQSTSAQSIVGFSLTGDYVDVHSGDLRVPFDGGDVFDIDGDLSTNEGLAAFKQALSADAGSNDTLSITYQQGGESTFRLTINAPPAGPVAIP